MAGQFYASSFFKQGFWAEGFWANTVVSVQQLVAGVGKKKKKEVLRVNLREVENRLSTADFIKQVLREKHQETIVHAKTSEKTENIRVSLIESAASVAEKEQVARKARIDRLNDERILLILAAAI